MDISCSTTYLTFGHSPSGLPHRLTEDNTYQGYLLPKGTILLSNIWYVEFLRSRSRHPQGFYRAILHDAEHFEKPMEFIPERYLGSSTLDDPRVHVFGYGRR
jgi:cytochrome P450